MKTRGRRVGAFALLSGAMAFMASSSDVSGADGRNEVDKTYLSLNGATVGWLSEVVHAQTATRFEAKLGFFPGAMSQGFYEGWLAPTLQGQTPLKAVRLLSTNSLGTPLSVLEAAGAAPSQIEFPAVSGAAGGAKTHFSLTFSVPAVQSAPPPAAAPAVPFVNLKNGIVGFRLSIDGIDCTPVAKIDAITVKSQANGALPSAVVPRQPAASAPEVRVEVPVLKGRPSLVTAKVTNTGLVIYVASSHAQPFQNWLTTSATTTKNGSLAYLRANGEALGTLSLNGLTIATMTGAAATSSDPIPRTKIEMSVGSIGYAPAPPAP